MVLSSMTIRFIHTADWHIGKPFRNLPADLAGELSAARLDAIARIAAIARARNASHVLVAGDVFDSDLLEAVVIRRALERMAREVGVVWILLPGNHDPARPGGLWDRIARMGAPENVTVILRPEPIVFQRDAMLLPAPLTSKNPGRDPTFWMDSAATPDGLVRIGLGHGSVQGFGSDGDTAVTIAKDRARTAGLAYLALGDWHGQTSIDAKTWYSGTPEPDRFRDNDPGFVLSVVIEADGTVQTESVKTAAFGWAQNSVVIRSAADFRNLEAAIAAVGHAPERLLMKFNLSGSLSLSEHASLAAWREVWSGKVRHLEIDDRELIALPEDSDLASLGGEGALVEAARALQAVQSDPSHPDYAAANLALIRLYAFAHEAREAP